MLVRSMLRKCMTWATSHSLFRPNLAKQKCLKRGRAAQPMDEAEGWIRMPTPTTHKLSPPLLT